MRLVVYQVKPLLQHNSASLFLYLCYYFYIFIVMIICQTKKYFKAVIVQYVPLHVVLYLHKQHLYKTNVTN